MTRFLHILFSAWLLALCMSSCTMVTEDVTDCPSGLFVRFVYDYNTQRADMFKDHVGHVTVYVYDESGRKVAERSVSNTATSAPLSRYGYTMHFTPAELGPGRYRIQAVGMQRDWDHSLTQSGAKYRRTLPQAHTDLTIKLDYNSEPLEASNLHHVVHENIPLDTLWHTLKVTAVGPIDGVTVPDPAPTRAPFSVYPLEEQFVEVATDRATYATVSLIRDTKHLNVTLRQIDDPANMHHDDFEITITDDNALLLHDNSVSPADSVIYTAYQRWTTKFTSGGVEMEDSKSRALAGDDDPDTQRTAHFNLMTNRMMHNGQGINDNAVMTVTNKTTGKVVARFNLPYYLAQARAAYAQFNYSPQEYLDREYDYHMNLFLKGESWAYCDIVVNVLGWSKRTQNVDLE